MLANTVMIQERSYYKEIEARMTPLIYFIRIQVCLLRLLEVTYALAFFRLEQLVFLLFLGLISHALWMGSPMSFSDLSPTLHGC